MPWYWQVAGFLFCFFLAAHYARVKGDARKGLILGLLVRHGELTGRQLKQRGTGRLTYNYLRDLEDEGLVRSRLDGISHPELGDLHRRHYRLKLSSHVATKAQRAIAEDGESP